MTEATTGVFAAAAELKNKNTNNLRNEDKWALMSDEKSLALSLRKMEENKSTLILSLDVLFHW